MDEEFLSVLERCLDEEHIPVEDCEVLLSMPEDSPEVSILIDKAEDFVRQRTGNVGEIGVQIGIIVGPCYVDCGFCRFAYSTTDVEDYTMKDDELTRYLKSITEEGYVTNVSLMTIHNANFDDIVHSVEVARSVLPEDIRLSINVGDLEPREAKALKDAGVGSAYHAVRLGESIDNRLEPMGRMDTIKNLKAAGIPVATGVEPIGPEHTIQDICRTYYNAMDLGCHCCSASARVPVPGTVLYGMETISTRRLQQIRSALMLSTAWCRNTELGFYGGFYGGFNRAFGEYAGNPKDTADLSEKGLKHTIQWARECLRNDRYTTIRLPNGRTEPI